MTQQEIRDEEALVSQLHGDIHKFYKMKQQDSRATGLWSEACRRFHAHNLKFEAFMALGIPQEIREVDGETRESALTFLEVDPWCYRSGYVKGRILRGLKRAHLTSSQSTRLHGCLLRVVTSHPRSGFRSYCRAAALQSTDTLVDKLEDLSRASLGDTNQQAAWMLGYINRHGNSEQDAGLKSESESQCRPA